jgi:hypothetical protein
MGRVRAPTYARLARGGNADWTVSEANENSGASSALGPIKNSPGERINEETRVRPFRDRASRCQRESHPY